MNLARPLKLDRMAIEEAGLNPCRLAAAIHDQLPPFTGGVPVRDIAYALDIIAIDEIPTKSLEAALVTTEERGEGLILLNGNSSPRRQRFGIAHELLHFLDPTHRPMAPGAGFTCTIEDLQEWPHSRRSRSRHAQQEFEANRFAIDLLAPKAMVLPFLYAPPNISAVIQMADGLQLSREAAARRYAELHTDAVAVVFSRDGVVRYAIRSRRFSWPPLPPGARTPLLERTAPAGTTMRSAQAEARRWLPVSADNVELCAQTYWQQDGYAMTLLTHEHSPAVLRD
jgi:Zn-dependent peptidase ImmA (M78 family)